MRKLVILMLTAFSFSLYTFSQKISLCEAFGQLVQYSDSGFQTIRGQKDESNTLSSTYSSKIEIADAIKTEIQVLTFKAQFVASYGDFKTEAEAIAKVEKLKKDFASCFPMVRFSDFSIDLFKSRQTNIIEQADRGFRVYKANFKIDKWKDTYSVSFNFPGQSKVNMFTGKEPVFTDYYTIPVQADNQQYSQDIRKIIAEGKTGFAAIMGNKLAVNIGGFECYDTNFKIDGVSNCYIEDRTMKIKNYVIPIVTNADVASIQNTTDEFLKKFMAALGPEYGFIISENRMVFDFVHKNSPNQKAATFLISVNDNKFDLTIYLSATL